MNTPSIAEKLNEFQRALDLFLESVEEDDKILAAVLVGSLNEETIWKRDSIYLWNGSSCQAVKSV